MAMTRLRSGNPTRMMKLKTRLALLPLGLAAALLTGCALAPTTQMAPNPAHIHSDTPHRKLFVFLDGTSNDWRARTNVRRLFELVAAQEDPTRLCLWVEGVGTKGVLGKGLGLGMKPRILAGYDFLARNYREGDEIYVFGFSRGAFEARTLCGMLAHCGLCRTPGGELARQTEKLPLDKLWKVCTELEEETVSGLAEKGAGSRRRGMSAKSGIRLGIEDRLKASRAEVASKVPGWKFTDAPVEFLGLWDTVPGLAFTTFNHDGEQLKHGHLNPQPRYKVKPYPNIKHIAHALSMDEVRSKFQPLLVGPPLVPGKTEVFEVWFPGAHSDIGGGYSDSNEVAGVSLDWMLNLLGRDALIPGTYKVRENPQGVIHHPELSFWGSFASKVDQRLLPPHAMVHQSFLDRLSARTPLWECLDPDKSQYVQMLYRPDPAVPGSDAGPAHPFVEKPLLPDGKPDPDRSKWVFDTKKFRAAFTIATTSGAKAEAVTGMPLELHAAQVKTAAVTAAPLPMAAAVVMPITQAPAPPRANAELAVKKVRRL